METNGYGVAGFDTAVSFWLNWGADPDVDQKYAEPNPRLVIGGFLVSHGYDPGHADRIVNVAREYVIDPTKYMPIKVEG
ncbi:MAG TPA: hypothetical protein VLH84_05710 [Patescibacteria group bacterium]|nr:hypothetical protein [Patescibacteria group bacterium]